MTDDPFVDHRSLLFTVAYEMLGSAADAEDIVQDTWLRWADVDRSEIRDARSYLVRIVTRLALNRLRALTRLREDYVGPWLPEPLLTSPDVADDVTLAESVSFAMLTVLETLAPIERAVFVLREVFETPYEEIAEVVGRSQDAVRQIAHRARRHVSDGRPRMNVDVAEQEAVLEKFIGAVSSGDIDGLIRVLAPDVVGIADGGGVVRASRKPIVGAEKLARALLHFARGPGFSVHITWVNGMPGVRISGDGGAAVVSVVVDGDRITHAYAISNPDKLTGFVEPSALER